MQYEKQLEYLLDIDEVEMVIKYLDFYDIHKLDEVEIYYSKVLMIEPLLGILK